MDVIGAKNETRKRNCVRYEQRLYVVVVACAVERGSEAGAAVGLQLAAAVVAVVEVVAVRRRVVLRRLRLGGPRAEGSSKRKPEVTNTAIKIDN